MEGKTMAIDSSIWIYQFQATMRAKDGPRFDERPCPWFPSSNMQASLLWHETRFRILMEAHPR